MWKWKCPACGKNIEEDFDPYMIRRAYTGYTHDCPECGELMIINNDGTCTDFKSVLERVSNKIDEMEASGEIEYDPEIDEYVDVTKNEEDS